jgi:hypothetical protein
MKYCKCGKEISPIRLKILPETTTCVECSNTKAKQAVPILYGTKDDTWVDVVFMEPEEYNIYNKIKTHLVKNKPKAEIQDFEKE